jgi:hypothetical protein
MPPDDLLRYVAQSAWPRGYADMYFAASLPPFEQYPAFDALMDRLAPVFGLNGTVRGVIALCWASFAGVLSLVILRRLKGVPGSWPWAAAGVITALYLCSGRLTLARPEMFLSIWALAVLLTRTSSGALIWAASGVVIGMAYWLSPIYFVFAVLLPLPWRARGMVFVAMCLAWALGWMGVTGDLHFESVRWMFRSLGSRLPGVDVTENRSIFSSLGLPLVLGLIFLAIRFWKHPDADARLLAVAGFLALSNQLRYLPLAMTLLLLYCLRPLAQSWVLPQRMRIVAWAMLVFASASVTSGLPSRQDLPRFTLPTGAKVFTLIGHGSYATLFFNAGRIQVTPAFEVGSALPLVQSMGVQLLRTGQLACAELREIGATHVVEAYMSGTPPACLQLDAVQDKWRLWRVSQESMR